MTDAKAQQARHRQRQKVAGKLKVSFYVKPETAATLARHPGGVIRSAVLEPLGLAISETARRMVIDRPALSRVIGGQHALSDDLAPKLEPLTGVSAELMIAMQHRHAWPAKRAQDAATIERVAA